MRSGIICWPDPSASNLLKRSVLMGSTSWVVGDGSVGVGVVMRCKCVVRPLYRLGAFGGFRAAVTKTRRSDRQRLIQLD